VSEVATSVDDCRLVTLPKIADPRGNLTFIEGGRHLPFRIRRVYWIYDVPAGEIRGGHAYRQLDELIVCVSGALDFTVDDARRRKTFTLNRAFQGLYVPRQIWRSIDNFATNTACLILASAVYDPLDYVRDFEVFRALKGCSA